MLRRWLIMTVAAAGVSLALAGGYAWAAHPKTYRDAVVEALDQRHLPYTGLEVHDICLPDPQCIVGDGAWTYAAVVVHGGGASYGLIICYDRRGDCYLDIASLGISRAPLRDLRGVRLLPKPLARLFERGARGCADGLGECIRSLLVSRRDCGGRNARPGWRRRRPGQGRRPDHHRAVRAQHVAGRCPRPEPTARPRMTR